ncbi:MAG TPA: response regulator [Thermomicrobiales bacterium]|nr:response regulator [Thermomicrobiales bacterium]
MEGGRGWRRGALLLLVVLLECGITALDVLTTGVPVSHLSYLPIILAAALYGYTGAAVASGMSLLGFILANDVWAPAAPAAILLSESALTLSLYLAVGLSAAAFFARQRQLAETGARLRVQMTQLAALYRVARAVAVSDDLDADLRTILDAVRELSAAPCAGIVPLTADLAERALPARAPGGRPAPCSPALAGRVAATGLALTIEDGAADDLALPAPWRALLALPLTVGGAVVGVLYAADPRPRRFTPAERQPLELLAQQAADAVAHARLRAQGLDLALGGERARLARELHDTLAQSLQALVLRLETTRTSLAADPGRAYDEVRHAETAVRATLQDARRAVRGLRPVPLERGTLVSALRDEVAAFGEQAGLVADVDVAGPAVPLPESVEDGLYGIAREALNNVRKHARARAVTVALTFAPDAVALTVRDDGVGCATGVLPDGGAGHFGLVGMRERARLLGGTFAVRAGRAGGTEVRVSIPREGVDAGAGEGPLRVLLCDDHALVRRGVADALLLDGTIAVVGEAAGGEEALRRVEQLQPDVVLLDLCLPDIDGAEVTRLLLAARAGLPILILTSFDDDPALRAALRAGARGCLLKDTPPADLIAAIRAVARGETVLAAAVSARLLGHAGEAPPVERLTQRELQVLQLVAGGARNKDIGHTLGITERTAKAHVSNIMQKLAADDRTSAVTIALRQGLLRL